MISRRTGYLLLGLWVALGVVLAPARPMPGMDMAPAAAPTASAAMPQHEGHGDRNIRHGAAKRNNSEPVNAETVNAELPSREYPLESTKNDHLARCVLCVVGAGMLSLSVTVLLVSSLMLQPGMGLLYRIQPLRFRHFLSRAPPAVALL